jgi:hypothetical protein
MSFGIQVENANGHVVIDGEFRNHVIIASGSGTTGSLAGFTLDSRVFKVTLGTPIALTRCPMIWGRIGSDNAYMGLVAMEVNGSAELTGFWIGSDVNFGTGPARTVEWRVTAEANAGSGESFGFQVFDAAGGRVFDSGLAYLDIASASTPFALTDSGSTITYASNANPWFCLSALAYLRSTSPSFDDTHWECGMVSRLSSTSARVALTAYAYLAGDTFYANRGGGAQQRQLVTAF